MEGNFSKFVRITALGLLFAYLPAGVLSLDALTLSQVRTRARVLALDSGSTRQRYTDAQLNAWANEAQRQAVLDSKAIQKSARFELASGTTYYDLPSDFLQMDRLTHDHETLPEVTPEALDRSNRWFETGAEPTHYYISFSSRTKIALYPWPESTSSTGTIRYSYWAQATDLSADADIPFGSITELYPYHEALVYYIAGRMSAIDGRIDLAALYLGEFRATVERMMRESKLRPSYRPGATGRIQ